MLFDTNINKIPRKSLSLGRHRDISFSNASLYDNVILPITNGHLP